MEAEYNDGPKRRRADVGISLDEEYSKISQNCPRSMRRLLLGVWGGASGFVYVDETVSQSR